MKTRQLRRGRNMFMIDFGSCKLENIKELLLSVFLYAWAQACIRMNSCVHGSVLMYAGLFLRFCILRNRTANTRSCLRTRALTCAREMPGRSPTLPIFISFSSVSLLYAILTHLLSFFHQNIIVTFFLSSSLHQNIIFPKFYLN